MAGTPGIAARVFSALAAGGINVVAIAQGSSELNISFVVSEAQAPEAQRRIHEAFQLSKIGGGAAAAEHAGRRRAARLRAGRPHARRTRSARRAAASCVSARSSTAAASSSVPAAFPRATSRSSPPPRSEGSRSLRPAAAGRPRPLTRSRLSPSTRSPARSWWTSPPRTRRPLLEKAARVGLRPRARQQAPALRAARGGAERWSGRSRDKGRRLRFEATVGAGLPILDTHRKLVESGDRVVRIEGCLSGTLGFLLCEIERGRELLRVPASARCRAATPSPIRATTSRARTSDGRRSSSAGCSASRASRRTSRSSRSCPSRARKLALPRFLERLSELDREWRGARRARALARTRRCATSPPSRGGRSAWDSLEVAPGSPFAALKGTDNQVAFTTARYRANPLVIQGPGAGLAVTAGGIFNDIAELRRRGRDEPRIRARLRAGHRRQPGARPRHPGLSPSKARATRSGRARASDPASRFAIPAIPTSRATRRGTRPASPPRESCGARARRATGLAIDVDQGSAALGRPGRQRRFGGGGGGGGQRASGLAAPRRRTSSMRVSRRRRRWPDGTPTTWRRRSSAASCWCARSIRSTSSRSPFPTSFWSCSSPRSSACARRRRAPCCRRRWTAASRSRRRRRSARSSPRSPAATTACCAARSTTGSRSRRARRSCRASPRRRRRRSTPERSAARSPGAGRPRSRSPRARRAPARIAASDGRPPTGRGVAAAGRARRRIDARGRRVLEATRR